MSRIIYISSPYNHPENEVVEQNFKDVSEFAAIMCSHGHVAFSPITYGHTLLQFVEMSSDWEFWKNFCLSFLQHCDELVVYKMPGWLESGGVKDEIEYAKEHNIKITYHNYLK